MRSCEAQHPGDHRYGNLRSNANRAEAMQESEGAEVAGVVRLKKLRRELADKLPTEWGALPIRVQR